MTSQVREEQGRDRNEKIQGSSTTDSWSRRENHRRSRRINLRQLVKLVKEGEPQTADRGGCPTDS